MSQGLVHPMERRRAIGKIMGLDYALLLLISLVATAGVAILYSVAETGTGFGSWHPWALKHLVRFLICLVLCMGMAMVNLRVWLSVAYPLYGVVLVLLVLVELVGKTAMGAQRWLDIGPVQIQPSEFMKIALLLALARYYHALRDEDSRRLLAHVPPILMTLVPAALVAHQPDLGTAVLLSLTGGIIVFLAGINWRVVVGAIVLFAASVPIAFHFVLHDYQKGRILTFLDPSRDPMGAGYHIMQSKIAMGSGGVFGKGFMQGTQSQLNFLPEKHTDFIFPAFAEEFGLVGGLGLLCLYVVILARCLGISANARSHFGRLMVAGLTGMIALYILINAAMVMGLAPVVGVPMPLLSYGGTSMISIMISFGLILSTHIHRHAELPRMGHG